jgi:predicted dehydrogenase
MPDKPIRVGIVGASADAGWARGAHVPALAKLPGFALTAVATTKPESARKAADAFGASHAFTSAAELAASDEVDLVVVSVKAPAHAAVAAEVIGQRKHLLCEWPMGANLAQSQAMADSARTAGVRGFVCLQARAGPEAHLLRDLIADGYLGRLYAASMFGSFPYWGDPISSGYGADAANGANVLTIGGGHCLDFMTWILGDPAVTLSARETSLRETVMAADEQRMVPWTSPDQFAVTGALQSGALFSAHIVGMAPREQSFRLRLIGDKGELLIDGDSMAQNAQLRICGTRDRAQPPAPIATPERYAELPAAVPSGPALNVAHLWRLVGEDLADGGRRAPDLDSGVQSRAVLDAISRSAADGGARVTPKHAHR